jgi:hypothetical protein
MNESPLERGGGAENECVGASGRDELHRGGQTVLGTAARER